MAEPRVWWGCASLSGRPGAGLSRVSPDSIAGGFWERVRPRVAGQNRAKGGPPSARGTGLAHPGTGTETPERWRARACSHIPTLARLSWLVPKQRIAEDETPPGSEREESSEMGESGWRYRATGVKQPAAPSRVERRLHVPRIPPLLHYYSLP